MENETLFKLLKEKYGTLTKAAEALGVDHSYLSHIKRGSYKPSHEVLMKLWKLVGVTSGHRQTNTLGIPDELITWNIKI